MSAGYQRVPVTEDAAPAQPQQAYANATTYDPFAYYSAQGIAVPPQLPYPPHAVVPMVVLQLQQQQARQQQHQARQYPELKQTQPQPQPQPTQLVVQQQQQQPATPQPVLLDEALPFHVEPVHTSRCMKLLLALVMLSLFTAIGTCAYVGFFLHLDAPNGGNGANDPSSSPPAIPTTPPNSPPDYAPQQFKLDQVREFRRGGDDRHNGLGDGEEGDNSSEPGVPSTPSNPGSGGGNSGSGGHWRHGGNVQVEVASAQAIMVVMVVYLTLVTILVPVVFLFRWPKSLELYPTTIVLRTYLSSHSVAYPRVEYAELMKSVLCRASRMNALCRQPRGMYTSFTNGFYFVSADCGQSIQFSPQDPERLVAQLRRTTLANRLVVPPQ